MNPIKLIAALLLYCVCLANTQASEIAIVVHPNNTNHLDERMIRQIFLGQIKTYPDGLAAQTFDNTGNDNLRSAFISSVLRRNESTMNAYWARMIFTAKAIPPQELSDSKTVKKVVANNERAISYMDSALVDESVRVVMLIAKPKK